MAQARWWLYGLLPLALLWLLAVVLETTPVEMDIARRAAAMLAMGPWAPSVVIVRGRDLMLGGDAFSETDRTAAVATCEEGWGVRLVEDRAHLVPVASPYRWSATKAQASIALAGDVPRPQSRTAIFSTAGTAGKVIDQAVYASGAPENFTEAAQTLVGLLGKLSEGTVSIEGTRVSLRGTAIDRAAANALDAALGGLPPGFTVAVKDIKVPAYTFSAEKVPATNTVTLGGTLPDTADREKLLAAARRMFVGQTVVDRTKLQPNAPAGFAAAATTGLEQLARLDGGTLALWDTTLTLHGSALYDRAVGQIRNALTGLGTGYTAKTDLTTAPALAPVDPKTCQDRFNDLLGKGSILFETGSAKIDNVSAGLLDRLVVIADGCPSQALEVSGHTDAAGNDGFNLDLSKKRAQAVVDYLVAAGLDARRLTAVGYGKSKPIASNDTEDGRTRNRRIEFLVK